VTDFFTKSEGLKRRRALLEELAKGAQDQPIVGNTGLGQALAKIATAFMTQKGLAGMEKEEGALAGERNAMMANEVQNYLTKFQGTPGQTMDDTQAAALMQNDVAPQLAEPVAADPRGAVVAALTSRLPEMQAVGASGMKELLAPAEKKGKGWTTVGSRVVSDADPTRVLADYSDPKDAKENWSEPYTIGGDLYQKNTVTNQIRKLDNAAKVSATATATGSAPANVFTKSLADKEGERLSKVLAERTTRTEAITAANSALAELDKGIYTGIAADWKKLGVKSLAAAKLADPSKAARTEQFLSYIGDIVLPRLKDIGGNDTVEELNYLKAITGGDVKLEEATLRAVLKSVDAKFRRRIAEGDDAVKRIPPEVRNAVPTLTSPSPVPEPYVKPPAPAKPRTREEILRKYGVKP
jgi:hypothetical protein